MNTSNRDLNEHHKFTLDIKANKKVERITTLKSYQTSHYNAIRGKL